MKEAEVSAKNMDDIVFEERNKSYGAYLLRKLYNRNILVALSVSGTVFSAILIFFLVKNLYFKEIETVEVITEVNMEMLDLPPITPEVAPPLPPPPPKVEMPPVETIKFVPPKVVPDKQVTKEEIPPTNEEMKDIAISNTTQEGDTAVGNIIPESDGVVGGVEGGEGETLQPAMSLPASYAGGMAAFGKCIQDKIVYTRMATMNEIEGVVYVAFTVSPEGKVVNVKVMKGKGLGYGLDEEALKAVEECGKGWSPAIQGGSRISHTMKIPVRFTLPDNY